MSFDANLAMETGKQFDKVKSSAQKWPEMRSGQKRRRQVVDSETTVGDVRRAVHDFVDARDWYRFHTPKNLAMSIAIETAELMEHFQWLTTEESKALVENDLARAEIADELADVLIYAFSFANSTGIDISDAIFRKLDRNQTRFPLDVVRGRLGDGDPNQ